MHNNYYFLRALSVALEQALSGFTLVSCFSQNKDELVIEFNNTTRSFFLKATLLPDFQCLSFPEVFHRARKNSIDLFSEITMKKVIGVRQFLNERSFALMLEENNALLFKMHGRQANVVLFRDEVPLAIFRNKLLTDLQLNWHSIDRNINWSFDHFKVHQHDLESAYFTFGKPVWNYLLANGFEEKTVADRWEQMEALRLTLESPVFSIVEQDSSIQLFLFPGSGMVFSDPVKAVNVFFQKHQSVTGFHREKAALLSLIGGREKQCQKFLEKTRQRLMETDKDDHYQQWADLIMANLHMIKTGMESIALNDFLEPEKSITVKLKKDLSPQRNAEAYYRKAKNRNIELNTLKESISRKEKELAELQLHEKLVSGAEDRETLEPLSEHYTRRTEDKAKKEALPFHEHLFQGYQILVGKNAKTNDELTLHHANKDDAWLHAKDVAGSHVIVRQQAGKSIPKNVIEFAASLAAFHSKRKNESLCPVTVTVAKYVRKRKGSPAGEVEVQREEVVMVAPWRRPSPNQK